jgi:23S rRNA (cytosine1962-C5)-methyltransferase
MVSSYEENVMRSVSLKPGRERSVLHRHPWVYSGAIANVLGEPEQGGTVAIKSSNGEFLAWGSYSPKSQILVRIWTWNSEEEITPEFLGIRLGNAIARRRLWIDSDKTNACRLIHAESDGLPGLIVDQYADTLVVQYLSSGVEYWREAIADILMDITGAESVYERSDATVRKLEGLKPRIGVLRGLEPSDLIQIFEQRLNFWVDVRKGHKTGFYIDQRQNREKVMSLALEKEVLDCFTYTGGFSIAALSGNARSILAVDRSTNALSLASKNVELNELPKDKVSFREGDVFQVLREYRDRGRSFDLIVMDPPKFAATSSQAERAARGYKDINLLALKLLRPGGMLATFSCSGGISQELFQKILVGAARDAGVNAQIIQYMRQGPDHPVALNFPEGAYLKGFVIQVN